MDAPVLDQLLEGQPRDLAPEAVERREDDRVRRVVDDEVDAGEMLERADVAALPADDPPLHVVGRELDDADRRLGRVARRDPLQGIGDEGPRPTLGVGARLLLELAHGTGELVADQVLRPLEELLARLAEREPADALELPEHLVVARLELLLQLLRVDLAIRDPLLPPVELLALGVELGLALVDALLDLRHLEAARLDLGLDLGPQGNGELAALDLCLTPGRLGLAVGVGEDRPALVLRQPQPRRARRPEPGPEADRSYRDSEQCRNDSEHGRSLSGNGPAAWATVAHIHTPPARRPPGKNRSCCVAISVGVPSAERRSWPHDRWVRVGVVHRKAGFRNALCAGEMSDEALLS